MGRSSSFDGGRAASLVAAAVAAGCGSVALASQSVRHSVDAASCHAAAVASAGSRRLAPAPRLFASADQGAGYHSEIRLRSAARGRIVSTLARFGSDFTNNGLALSAHARDVYFTLIPAGRGSNLLIERVATSTHRQKLIAHGWEPSLSPNGRLLAYLSYRGKSESVAVENLASGRVRLVNVDAALGHGLVPAEIQPGWTRDSSEVVLATGPPIRAISGSAPRGHGSRPGASAAARLVVVSVASQGPLTARRVSLSGLGTTPDLLAADALARDSVMAASFGPGGSALLDRIDVRQTRATACPVLSIPNAQVVAFDPTGQRLIYLLGHRPPRLWRATIKHGRLTGRQRLRKDPSLGAIAW